MDSKIPTRPELPEVIDVKQIDVFMGLKKGSPYIGAMLAKYREKAVMPLHHRQGKEGLMVENISSENSVISEIWIKGDVVNFRITCKDAKVNVRWLMCNDAVGFYATPEFKRLQNVN